MKFTKSQKFFIFCLVVLLAELAWAICYSPDFNEEHIAYYNEAKEPFEFSAYICSEPDVRLDHQKLTVCPLDYQGKVLLRTELYPEYEYGQVLQIKVRLQSPEPIEDFRYDQYLAKSGIYSVGYQPSIKKLDQKKGNLVIAKTLQLKKFMQNQINKTVAEPQAALVGGILVGTRQGMPAALLEQFNITGITHIIAISGFNITIIVVLLLNLCKHFYINRKKAIWAIIIGLIFFVILTGASPSVVRAAIMGFLVVLARHLGRKNNIRNALILSAVLMAGFNPKILIWDSGFQLSFLSTIGLVYLVPRLERYFSWLPEKLAIRENTVSTLSAIIFTLPLILFQFGRLSIVAPVVNLLVLPVIPVAMMVGFVQFLASIIHLVFGQIVGWISWLLLGYVIKVVEIFSSFSWASVDFKISWWVMAILYIYLFMILFGPGKEKKR